jgi:type I restriction enzyme S subunit
MRKGWEIKKLGDVCDTGAGGTPLKAHKDYYENGDIPWLLSGEVSQGEIYNSRNYITKKGLKNSSAKLFPINTVLVAMYGATAGQVGILKFEACTNQAVCGILPNEKFIPKYIYYCFLSKKKELIAQAVGGAQPNISQIKIKNTKLPVISISEQQEIVSILDEAFESIERAKSNAEKNLKNAKELFDSYLQGVFENKGKDWEEKKLGEICNIIGGGTPSKSNVKFYDGTIYWATVRDMKGEVIKDTEHKITKDAVKNSSTNIIPKGNVIIATRVGLGRVCLIQNDTAINQDLRGVVPINSNYLSVDFLYRWFKSIAHKIVEEGTGATVQGVKLPFIKSLIIYIPPIKEQNKIISKLDAITAETKKLESIYQQKLNDLEELKKSILQKAFNGELKTSKISA